MEMITTKSGGKLEILIIPFKEAHELFKVMTRELRSVRMGNKFEMTMDVLLTLMSSEAIEKALWPVLKRCLYNGQKIDETSFESDSAREDYIEVVNKVLEVATAPFSSSLSSLLKTQSAGGIKGRQ